MTNTLNIFFHALPSLFNFSSSKSHHQNHCTIKGMHKPWQLQTCIHHNQLIQALNILQQRPQIYSASTHNEHILIPKVTQETWPMLQEQHQLYTNRQVQFAQGTLFLSHPNRIIPISCGTETAPQNKWAIPHGTKTAPTNKWNL